MCDQQSLKPALYSMSVKLLTEHHLEFLSLKGGCTSSSESTLVEMPHCCKITCRGSSEDDLEMPTSNGHKPTHASTSKSRTHTDKKHTYNCKNRIKVKQSALSLSLSVSVSVSDSLCVCVSVALPSTTRLLQN